MPIKIGQLTLYSIEELSKKLDVTPLTLRGYINTGKLKGRRMGGRMLASEARLVE